MLAQAIDAEVSEWIDDHRDQTDKAGHRQVVRNGHLPERTITTGVGPVEVEQPRVLDRRHADEAAPFSSKVLPPYLRKTKSLEELILWLYLKGVSTGDFSEALPVLVGPRAEGLSASTVVRLKQSGSKNTRRGVNAPWREGSTSTSGPMASTSMCVWKKIDSAFSSCWGPPPTAIRN